MGGFLNNLQSYIGNNSIAAYPLVFLAGVLVSFTPCVYPLIPITVGYIGASGSNSARKNFLLSLFYIFGLSLVYVVLGVVASLTGRLFGQISASPWTYVILGGVFVILGLSATGLYSIPFIGVKKTSLGKPQNYLGCFLVGAASGLIAGPCTAPALGVILAYVATKESIIFGISLLFTFALGMSMLLLFLGTFSSLIKRIPKAGRFNLIIEKMFGIILLVVGLVFLIVAAKRFI